MIAKQTTDLEFYQDALDEIYNEYISPIMKEETYPYEGENHKIFNEHYDRMDVNFWDNNKTETPENRCSYDTYNELKTLPLIVSEYRRNTASAGCYRKDKNGNDFLDQIKYKYTISKRYKNITNIQRFPITSLAKKLEQFYGETFRHSNPPKRFKKYKQYNGYMGWHTNHNKPGGRWYFVYNVNENSSFMRFIDPKTEKMTTVWEPKGWSLKHFVLGDAKAPLWHCIYTDSERWSIGLKKGSGGLYKSYKK